MTVEEHKNLVTKKRIAENLKLLHGIKIGGEPSLTWVARNRAALLASIKSEARDCAAPARFDFRNLLSLFRPAETLNHAFRYGGAVMAAFLILLGSGAAGASAMYESVPGDALYPLKRATEKAQVTLTPSSDAKARLQVEFVGRRVEEIAKITNRAPVDQAGRVAVAVSELRSEVKDLELEMQAMKSNSPKGAVELAKLVDRRADQFHAALQRSISATNDSLSSSASGIVEAKNLVVDASVKAVAIIIENHANGAASSPRSEVAISVGEKIKAMNDRLDAVEDNLGTATPSSVKESASQAKAALVAAKELVEKSDLSGALVKVIEGKELVRAAETIVIATNEAGPQILSTSSIKGGSGLIMTGLTTSSEPKLIVSSTPQSAAKI